MWYIFSKYLLNEWTTQSKAKSHYIFNKNGRKVMVVELFKINTQIEADQLDKTDKSIEV